MVMRPTLKDIQTIGGDPSWHEQFYDHIEICSNYRDSKSCYVCDRLLQEAARCESSTMEPPKNVSILRKTNTEDIL
jgi:hypothetical protein